MSAGGPVPVALVVEDEPLVMIAAADIIEDLGFIALCAANADEAILILEKRDDIRLVFTDVNMPGYLDGIALAKAVRNRWPPIKILVVSGNPFPELDTLPIGAMFLKKPYARRHVDSIVREMFG
jgi:CheY-like chemotaxis protein